MAAGFLGGMKTCYPRQPFIERRAVNDGGAVISSNVKRRSESVIEFFSFGLPWNGRMRLEAGVAQLGISPAVSMKIPIP